MRKIFKFKYPPEIDTNSFTEKFAYHEFIYNAGAGFTSQIRGLVGDMILSGTFMTVLGLQKYWWLLILGGIGYLFFMYIIGWLLQRKNIVHRRGSVTNKLANPQLMEILKNSKN